MNKQPDRTRGWAYRWILQRSLQIHRHEGVISLLRRALAFLAYKSGIWYVGWYIRRLDSPIGRAIPGLEAHLAELTADDVEEYLQFYPNISSEQYLERFREGQTCFVVRESTGTLASGTWTAVGRVWIDFVGREVALQEDEVYLYDSYTVPEFRGKRLQPFLCDQILARFQNSGYRQAVVIIAPENRSNISSRKRSGFVRMGLLFRIRIGSLRYDFFRGIRRYNRTA